MSKSHQQIVERSIASLKPYAGNARTHSKKQVKQIARSIERFGFTNPVEGKGPLTGRTVRTKRFRYTAWVDKSGKVAAQELYDLSVDSDESVNRAGDPKYSSDIARLEGLRVGGWEAQRANLR